MSDTYPTRPSRARVPEHEQQRLHRHRADRADPRERSLDDRVPRGFVVVAPNDGVAGEPTPECAREHHRDDVRAEAQVPGQRRHPQSPVVLRSCPFVCAESEPSGVRHVSRHGGVFSIVRVASQSSDLGVEGAGPRRSRRRDEFDAAAANDVLEPRPSSSSSSSSIRAGVCDTLAAFDGCVATGDLARAAQDAERHRRCFRVRRERVVVGGRGGRPGEDVARGVRLSHPQALAADLHRARSGFSAAAASSADPPPRRDDARTQPRKPRNAAACSSSPPSPRRKNPAHRPAG
mmetsp:Transcript_9379/g.41129  ORF Transcript_9379/g.41129 Transcript_9379/m.41129 type:complete len:291 (+) Transcript_9379:85-957(+)